MTTKQAIFIFAFLFGCSKSTDKASNDDPADSVASRLDTIKASSFDYESLFKFDSYLTRIPANDSVQMVDFDCAIMVYPTAEQIDEMKKTDGDDNFYIEADDANWYQVQSMDTLNFMSIKTINASGKFVRLVGSEQTWDLDIRKKNLPAWNLIFFKTTKEPRIMSTADLTSHDVKDYFEIGK